MVNFFLMVFNGITIAIEFFSKFTGFANTYSILTAARLGARKLLFAGLIVLVVAYVAVLIAFFYFMIDAIVSAYNLVSAFLEKIQTVQDGSGSVSPLMQSVFVMLHASGFVQGFYSVFPFIASAITFRLVKILYNVILEVHFKLYTFYKDSVLLLTAS